MTTESQTQLIDSEPEVVYAKEQARLKAEARLASEEAARQQAEAEKERREILTEQMQAAVDWSFARFGTYNAFSNPTALSGVLRQDGIRLQPNEIVQAMQRAISGSIVGAGSDGKSLVEFGDGGNSRYGTGKVEDYGWMWTDNPST